MATLQASLAIFLLGRDALLAQISDQPRMRLDVELEAALLHPHGRGDGPDLDLICGLLHVEAGQDLLGDPPGDDGVNRRVVDLLLA